MRTTPAALAVALFALLASSRTPAQTPAGHDHGLAGASMDMGMGDSTLSMKHMRMTPSWPVQPGDSARADSVVRVARVALAQYADVSVAEQDGYRMFAPKVKQRVYHYTRRKNALKARMTFDPTAPSSLLYAPLPDGKVRLIGAMYTASPDMSLDDLNRRIPLSIAQWHQHTSLCLPPGSGLVRGGDELALGNRDPRFGVRGSISTEEECNAAGGEFHRRMFGWMVHVNLFGDDAHLWEHRH
ncbi:MAG: hypothetical protein ABI742_04105 [Gemmatimonadota bacterium]